VYLRCSETTSSTPRPTLTAKEQSMKDTSDEPARDNFEAAVKKHQARIDAMPYGPVRGVYIEGLTDAIA
jgi:hypothetical protein